MSIFEVSFTGILNEVSKMGVLIKVNQTLRETSNVMAQVMYMFYISI